MVILDLGFPVVVFLLFAVVRAVVVKCSQASTNTDVTVSSVTGSSKVMITFVTSGFGVSKGLSSSVTG